MNKRIFGYVVLAGLLVVSACGKQPVPVPEPVPEQDSLAHYDYYNTATTAELRRTTTRYDQYGNKSVSEFYGRNQFDEEGMIAIQESFQDGVLSIRSVYTYGDHTTHRVMEIWPDTWQTIIDYTYEDAERTRALVELWTYSNSDHVGKTIRTWENGRMVLEETYVTDPEMGLKDYLTARIEYTYTETLSDDGLVRTLRTVTVNRAVASSQIDKETTDEEVTTYRDTSRRQPESIVTTSSKRFYAITKRFTYNEDNLKIRVDTYYDDLLWGVNSYAYQDNVVTECYYESNVEQVSRYTFATDHIYTSPEEIIPSPFERQ